MPTLLSTLQADVLTLTLNRPERANSFNVELISELQEAFSQAEKDSQVRVIILTGSGKAFSAGQDISEMQGGGVISYRTHLKKTYNPLVIKIRRIEKPVLAAINGPCAGAALGIALACDLRLATEEAKLAVGFGGIGLVPDSAVSLLLPVLIGLGRAEQLYFNNAPVYARQALEWGLLNRIFPAAKFMDDTLAYAKELASGPIRAFGLAKQAFNRAVLSNLEDVLNTEADLQEIAGNRPEHKEGVAAFWEKRKPKYKNDIR